MSATIIEMLIKEAVRDGNLSQTERESIYKEAEALGSSRALVDTLIDDCLTSINAKEAEKAEMEKKRRDKDENRKYELWDLTFQKLVREWINKSPKRLLDKKDYLSDLRREASNKKIEFGWLDNWIEKLEKEEQEIAGIKSQGIIAKLKGFFDK
jgi:hypothetical protein